MNSTEFFIRNSDIQIKKFLRKNLKIIADGYGRGFQALIVKITKQNGDFLDAGEISKLVNGMGSLEFSSNRARTIERSLMFPPFSLDLPGWHFARNLDIFLEYISQTSNNRDWFDSMIKVLIDIPFKKENTDKANVGKFWDFYRSKFEGQR